MNKYFDQFEQEFVEKLTKMIQAKPLSEQEKGVADLLIGEFEKMGVEHYRDEVGNVIAVIRGTKEGPTIMTNGHMDIVPEGNPVAWTKKPFDPEYIDGVLYGRGTSDMLSGLLSAFMAFREVKQLVDEGAELAGNLVFTGVVNEEPAESMGVIELMKESLPRYDIKPDFILIGEPTDGNVSCGQRGKVELVVDVYGKVAHSAVPWQGVNAFTKAQPLINAITNNFFEDPMVDPDVGPECMTITDVELTPGRMYSCVPDKCSITIDRRYILPHSIQYCIDQIQSAIDYLASQDPDFKAEVHQRINHRGSYTGKYLDVAKQHPAWKTELDNEFVVKTFEALRSVGQDPGVTFFKPGCDGSVTKGVYDIPTVGYSWQDGLYPHLPDERCVIADQLKAVEGYTKIFCDMLGLDFSKFMD